MGRMQVLAVVILTAWLSSTLFIWFAATRTFRTADHVLKEPNPQFEEDAKPLAEGQARMLLRYLASAINRTACCTRRSGSFYKC